MRMPIRVRFVALISRAILLLLVVLAISAPAAPMWQGTKPRATPSKSISQRDAAFLEDLSRRSFRYFWERADPRTGLVLDRARADGSIHDEAHRNIASIAATGFGLTALCIGAERGWV